MRQKIFLYAVCLMGGVLFMTACSKGFLNVEPKGEVPSSAFYKTASDAYGAMVAAYNPLGIEICTGDNTYASVLGGLNSAADECYTGGGGANDVINWQVWNTYQMTASVGPQIGYWNRNYTGLYRANLLLSQIDSVQGLDAGTKARYIAEMKWLRAYYNFWLVRLFRNIVLTVSPISSDKIYQQRQTTPDTVYAQIEKDLHEAIPDLPVSAGSGENGRVTRGAGYALLGKVIIYENNNSRMQEAAGYLEQVNGSGVYQLLPVYADLFSPDNKFNSESVFEIVHTSAQSATLTDWPNFQGNVYVQMAGPRSWSGPLYNSGWSFNPIITSFAKAMYGDPRYTATILDADSLTRATGGSYTPGYANTGKFINKYAPLQKFTSLTGDPRFNYPNDYIEIRLADTYLLEAEALVRGGGDLSKAQYYLDKVRARVGLSPVPVTLANIYKERMLELATEGHRWFDLVRTGQAATVLAFKGFKAGTHEVLPIPQVELNNTLLRQNPGY